MMKDQEISSDKQSSKVNALLIIDVQEKIIRPIFNKDSIIKNIKKLIDAYQILEKIYLYLNRTHSNWEKRSLNYYPKPDLKRLKRWYLA